MWPGVQTLPGYGYRSRGAGDPRNGVYQDFRARVTYNQTTFGNIRQPYTTPVNVGIRKNFTFTEAARIELRMDAYNVLNHPTYSGVGTTVGSQYFGYVGSTSFNLVNQSNQPRAIQFSGRIYF